MNEKDSIFKRSVILGLLAVLTFALYFFRMRGFGLYEDDYFFVGSFIGDSGSEIYSNTVKCLKEMPQGRPLAFLFPAIITYFGVSLTDDLVVVYSIGALFCLANAFLVYTILRKWISLASALVGAMIFLLSPADTTKILLTHNLILQPSLFCALLGITFYTRQSKIYLLPAYIFGAMTLLFYESGILVFLFAPFFVINNKNSFIKRLLAHIGLIALTIICFSLLRASHGESRMNDIIAGSKLDLIFRIVTGPFIGIGGSLAAMIYGTLKGIQKALVIEILPILIAGTGFILWLMKYFSGAKSKPELEKVVVVTPFFLRNILAKLRILPAKTREVFEGSSFSIQFPAYILFVGALMIPAAYLLAFTHYPPVTLSGRLTSVHLAATVAWAVFAGGSLEFLLTSEIKKNLKQFLIAATGVIMIFWSSYAIYLQDGFYTVWSGQKIFWKEVTALTPDLDENTVVVFEKKIAEYSRTWCYGRNIISGADWSLPITFKMYMGDQLGSDKPKVIKSVRELIWQKNNEGIRFFYVGLTKWGEWSDLNASRTIYFSMNPEGDLQRVREMAVYDYQLPIRFETVEGVTSAKPSIEVPARIISSYYYVRKNQAELMLMQADTKNYMRIEFKQMPDTVLLKPFNPDGFLRNFMETGKFGLTK